MMLMLNQLIGFGAGRVRTGAQVTVFLTSGTSYTVPSDCYSLEVHIIGKGATGGATGGGVSTGGHGGGFAYKAVVSVSPGASVAYSLASDVYFNGANLAASSVGVHSDGTSANSIGDLTRSGGTGATDNGGGGGGAAGYDAAGANGSGTSGGAGNGGLNGGGSGASGGNGGAGTNFDASHGSGGGGAGDGGTGGAYGGGGGGEDNSGGTSQGPGGAGLIMLKYYPEA